MPSGISFPPEYKFPETGQDVLYLTQLVDFSFVLSLELAYHWVTTNANH